MLKSILVPEAFHMHFLELDAFWLVLGIYFFVHTEYTLSDYSLLLRQGLHLNLFFFFNLRLAWGLIQNRSQIHICCISIHRKFTWMLGRVLSYIVSPGVPGGSDRKNLPTMQETLVWSLVWEGTLKKGIAYLVQYSCLENSMGCGAWKASLWGRKGRKELDTTERLTHTNGKGYHCFLHSHH